MVSQDNKTLAFPKIIHDWIVYAMTLYSRSKEEEKCGQLIKILFSSGKKTPIAMFDQFGRIE